MSDEKLSVVVADAPAPIVAGLPPAVRSAFRAKSELPGASVSVRGEALLSKYRTQLSSVSLANGEAGALRVSGAGFPAPGALAAFVEAAKKSGGRAAWVSGGRVAAELGAPGGPSLELPGWTWAETADEAARAEKALFASLPKDTDGYIAMLDRKLSIAISSVLLNFPVTPNDITTASLVLGLLGAWLLASGSYWTTLAGAALLWFCCLLDGCDGEVARLKLLCSPSGAAYDLWADHVAHLATFVAIPFAVHRAHPEATFKLPGVLLVSGFLGCMFSVWWLVLRKPESERGPFALLIERVASRDYVYLIVALAALGRLDWFLWAAAFGSHVFYLALWAVSLAGPKSAASPLPLPDR